MATEINRNAELVRLADELAAAKLATINELSGVPGLFAGIRRDDYNFDLLDYESSLPAPRRAAGNVVLDETGSFADYVNRHAGPDTVIYVMPRAAKAIAVFNDHAQIDGQVRGAGWRDLRATLQWRQTDAWKHWRGVDRKMLEQEAFAEHIEEGLSEIVSPAGADLLEIAQTFKASMATNVRSARYLRDGRVSIAWDETIDAVAGRDGTLTIPNHIELSVAPFEGSDRATISARLRYRLSGRNLTLGYLLDRPVEFERAAIDAEMVALVDAIDTDVPVIVGTPDG